MKKAILFIFLGLMLLWVTGIILENFFDVDLDKYFNRSSPAAQAEAPAASTAPAVADSSGWTTYKNGDFHFSIDAPFEMKEASSPVTATKSLLVKGQTEGNKFMVQITAFNVPAPDIDLNKAMDTQVKMFKLMDKIMTNLQFSSSPVTFADTPGLLGVGTYQIMGKLDWEIKILKLKKDSTLMDVLVQYQATDENRGMADKVLHSLSFSN